jgi:hypothetical protein
MLPANCLSIVCAPRSTGSIGQKSMTVYSPELQSKLYFYKGRSMLGIFQPGDQLVIRSLDWERIRPGDIILFRKNDQLEIVHRVIAVAARGLVTRGDNNGHPDDGLVSPEDLVGIVTGIKRGRKLYAIKGGRPGLLRSNIGFMWNRLRRLVIFAGCYPYRWLVRKHWIKRFWRPALVKIRIETEHGPLIKYMFGRRTVARWWPTRHYFECRKPFDLIISNPEKNKQK